MSDLVKTTSNEISLSWDTPEKIQIIKNQLTKDLTIDEFGLFIAIAKSTGLNPLKRQIYAIKRKGKGGDQMSIQTGIDGYRSIAARCGSHIGTSNPSFVMKDEKFPVSASVIVKKLVRGHIAEFEGIAYWDEYAQLFYSQEEKKYKLGNLWEKFPKLMLGKCAEALALRRAFPEEMSGIYVEEEINPAVIPDNSNHKGNTFESHAEKPIQKSPEEQLKEQNELVDIGMEKAKKGVGTLLNWAKNELTTEQQILIKPKYTSLKQYALKYGVVEKVETVSNPDIQKFDDELVDISTGEVLNG